MNSFQTLILNINDANHFFRTYTFYWGFIFDASAVLLFHRLHNAIELLLRIQATN